MDRTVHIHFRRCGRRSYHVSEKQCAACSYGNSQKISNYRWKTKKVTRKRTV